MTQNHDSNTKRIIFIAILIYIHESLNIFHKLMRSSIVSKASTFLYLWESSSIEYFNNLMFEIYFGVHCITTYLPDEVYLSSLDSAVMPLYFECTLLWQWNTLTCRMQKAKWKLIMLDFLEKYESIVFALVRKGETHTSSKTIISKVDYKVLSDSNMLYFLSLSNHFEVANIC